MTIQEVQTLYFDKKALREPSRKLRRVDGGDLRWYYSIEDGQILWFISVTSLLSATMPMGEHLLKWYADRGMEKALAERDEKAAYGTAMHVACEKVALDKFSLDYQSVCEFLLRHGVATSYANQLQKDTLSFAQFCKDYEVRPLAVEVLLSNKELGLAGACDLVCEMTFNRKRIIAMIDMKSGRKGFWEEAEIQLHAYKRLWESEFPDVTIDKVFSWSPKDWTSSPTYNFKDQSNSNNANKLDHLLAIFRLSGVEKPKPHIEFSGEIGLGDTLNDKFRVLSIEDYIVQNESYFREYIEVGVSDDEDSQEYILVDEEFVESPFGDTEKKSVKTNYLDF